MRSSIRVRGRVRVKDRVRDKVRDRDRVRDRVRDRNRDRTFMKPFLGIRLFRTECLRRWNFHPHSFRDYVGGNSTCVVSETTYLHFKSGKDGYEIVPGEKSDEPGDFLKKFMHFSRERPRIALFWK